MKDSIDFGSMDVSMLFRKLLVPTVLGMVFSAIFVITDGIFVGKGIGSDALAAVNIAAPFFMIATGMFFYNWQLALARCIGSRQYRGTILYDCHRNRTDVRNRRIGSCLHSFIAREK